MHKFGRRKKEHSENMTELVKAELTPQQKEKRKKRIIGGVIAVALVLFIVSRVLTPAALPMVMVRSAEKGTVRHQRYGKDRTAEDLFFTISCQSRSV